MLRVKGLIPHLALGFFVLSFCFLNDMKYYYVATYVKDEVYSLDMTTRVILNIRHAITRTYCEVFICEIQFISCNLSKIYIAFLVQEQQYYHETNLDSIWNCLALKLCTYASRSASS